MLIDTHAHLYWDSYKTGFDEMIQRAINAGISTIINIGVDIEKSQVALDQAKNTDWPAGLSIYSTIGIHPHEAIKYDSDESLQKDMDKLEQIYLSDKTKVVGIGECGLDYFFDPSFAKASEGKSVDISQIKALQKKLFQAHIDLAKKLSLPLIVHCRDDRSKDQENSEAWNEVIKMVGTHPTVLHCYSGLSHTTNYLLTATNLLVSFAANITYPKNDYLREAAKILPLNRILLETDSPFLAPQSKRGQRNEPASVKEIAQLIADLKGISFEEVAEQTAKNAISLFSLKKL